MARKPTPGPGHNSRVLSDDEVGALQVHFGLKIRRKRRELAGILEEAKIARTELNATFKLASLEMAWNRLQIEDVLAQQDKTEAEFQRSEAARRKRYAQAALATAEQANLFGTTLDTVDDAAAAYLDGKRAGIRADDPVVPGRIATMFHTEWQRGWADGQTENVLKLQAADEVLAANAAHRAQASGGMAQGENPDDAEDEDVDEEQEVDDAARKLKASSWMEPTDAESEFA